VVAELGRLTVGGSCNLRAGRSFSIDAFFASPVGTFVGSFASSLGVIVGRLPPVAPGTPSHPCPSWLAILDTVYFKSFYESAPREAEPCGHNHGNQRSPSMHANPSLIRSPVRRFDHSLVN